MCGCTCAKHSVKYRMVYNTKITFHSFSTSHKHMVLSCKVHRRYGDGKDAQLLVLGHVTVSQSDPVKTQLCNTQTCI